MSGPALLAHAEPAMGTVFSFALLPGALPAADLRSAVSAACACLHEADAIFSTWDQGSPVSRYRRGEAGLAGGPAELGGGVDAGQAHLQATGGRVDQSHVT